MAMALYRNLPLVKTFGRHIFSIQLLSLNAVRNRTTSIIPKVFNETVKLIPTQGVRFCCKNMENLLNDPRRHFDYQTLLSKKEDGAILIIDVRQPEELAATGTIPDSINIPLKDVEDALAAMTPEAFRMKYGVDKPSKGALIVFSCQSGRRSVAALEKALFLGYLNAGNYKGGWLDWERNNK